MSFAASRVAVFIAAPRPCRNILTRIGVIWKPRATNTGYVRYAARYSHYISTIRKHRILASCGLALIEMKPSCTYLREGGAWRHYEAAKQAISTMVA